MSAGRAAEVWRRQRATDRDLSGRRFWTNLTLEQGASLAGGMFLLLQAPLEAALWWSAPPWRGSRELFGRLALGLLVLSPVSGVLLERYLARRTPPGMTLRPEVRLALGALGSLPLAGFFLIPLGRRFMEGASPRALRPDAARLDLETPSVPLPRGLPLQAVYTSGAFALWLVIPGILLLLIGSLWLAAGEDLGAILVVCAALHLAQAGCMALYAESDLRFTHQSRHRLRLAPWLCLLPQPAPLLALFLVIWPQVEGPRSHTLTWSTYARARSVRRYSQWMNLRLELQEQWEAGSWIERWIRPRGLELPPHAGRAEAARRTWIRTKALLLPFEASLAIGWLTVLTGPGSEADYDPIRDPALRPWLLAAIVIAVLGLLQAAAGSLARLLRLPRPALFGPPATGLYLFITQAALVFGLLVGPLAAYGRFDVVALLSIVSGVLALGLAFLLMALSSLPASRPGALADSITWPLSLLLGGFLPLPLALFPDQAWMIIVGLTLLIPSIDIFLGLRSLPWIHYPFTVRDLFDRRPGQGAHVSVTLGVLIALLPLGGLVLPLWVWSHRSHLQRKTS